MNPEYVIVGGFFTLLAAFLLIMFVRSYSSWPVWMYEYRNLCIRCDKITPSSFHDDFCHRCSTEGDAVPNTRVKVRWVSEGWRNGWFKGHWVDNYGTKYDG